MKKIIAILMVSVLAFSMFTSSSIAAAGAALNVNNVSGEAGETVDVTISITDNPGLVALRFNIGYDATKLNLIEATDAGLLGTNTAFFGNDFNANPYTLMWEDGISSVNHTGNGIVATLRFEILATAQPGDTSIEICLDQGSTFNYNMDNVLINTVDGIVTITGDTPENPVYTDATLAVSESVACPADTIEVQIVMYNNPGIVALSIGISYDREKLALIRVADGGLMGNGTSIFGNDFKASPYRLIWEDGLSQTNHTDNGTLATLTFKVKSDATAGDTEISLSYDPNSTFDVGFNNVAFDTVGSAVKVNKIIISSAMSSVFVGDAVQLSAHYALDNIVAQNVVWTSANTNIATVDSTGLVTGRAGGNVTINATTGDGLYNASYTIQVRPVVATMSIYNYGDSYSQKVNWWKNYSTATMMLGYHENNCNDAVQYVWSSSSSRVKIDQSGNVTNTGLFSRSATITLTAYSADNIVVASDSVKVSFYKFNWQKSRLQSQSIVSDNVFAQHLSEQQLEACETKQPNSELYFITNIINCLINLFRTVILFGG